MGADPSAEQTQQQDISHEHEILDQLSMAVTCLAAAEGPDVEAMAFHATGPLSRPWPWHSIRKDSTASALELRTEAIGHFCRAAELCPDNPWIWFQVGWNSFADKDGPYDRQFARSALERVLELNPDHAVSHLALAWLLQQETCGEMSNAG